MKKYTIRALFIILFVVIYFPVNHFFEKKEIEFSQPHTFTFQPPMTERFYEVYNIDKDNFEIQFVLIAGAFSGWSSTDPDFIMEKVSNNVWQKTLSLDKGRNPYKYVLFPKTAGMTRFEDFHYSNGFWVEDLNAEIFEDDNYGGVNSVFNVRTTKTWKKIFNFLVYTVVLGLVALTLLEFAVKMLMHARLSLKSKLIIILGIFLVLSNIFFIYNNYRQYSQFTRTSQIDKFNFIHNLLLGEEVDFDSLKDPQTINTITNTLDRLFKYSNIREDFALFSNTKQQIARLWILDKDGQQILNVLEPSQVGYFFYWFNGDKSRRDEFLRFQSDNLFLAYKESHTGIRELFTYQTYQLFQDHPRADFPDELLGKSTLQEMRFFPDDLYLYPIYNNNQHVGYYLAAVNTESYSQGFLNILVFNIILILILSGLFFLLISQLGEIILEPLHNVIKGINRIQKEDYDYEIEISTQDEIKTLGDSYNYLREFLTFTRNKVEYYTQHLEEIVEERTLELKEANNKLKEIDTLKSQFFANISHDLRTPLTLILAPIEFILEENEQDPEEIKKYLQTIHSNALRLLNLINDLLDFSKLEAGRLKPSFVKTNIVKILTFLVSTLEPAAQKRELNIVLDIRSHDSEIYVDPGMFEKILMNLLSNAFKFTPVKGEIRISLDVKEENVILSISDTGVGIPRDKLEHIFERFAQVDGGEKREFEGTGIGLSLVKELMDLHHGEIAVESSQGKGATFSISFKKGFDHLEAEYLSEESQNEVISFKNYMLSEFQKEIDDSSSISDQVLEKNSTIGMLGTNEMDVSGARILVVDDKKDMRDFIISLLSSKYECLSARDGQEALELAEKHHPDIILSDVMMPRMTGYELCDAIKNSEELKHIPIVLLTAKVDVAGKLEGLSHRADDYLSKPFNSHELLVRIKNLLISRKMEMQLYRRQKEIEQDLTQASLVQNSILTSARIYREIPDLEIDVRYHPMTLTVSGDYYHITPVHEGRASIIIADTAGHGLQAALSTMQLDVLVRESHYISLNPSARLEYINKLFVQELKTRNFLTVFNMEILKDQIIYSSAGHPAQYLIKASDREVISLTAQGKAIGFLEESSFELGTKAIQAGDILLLFTDGVYEEFSPQGTEYGDEKLKALIKEWAAEGRLENISMKQFTLDIMDAINVYLGKEKVCDDITIMAIRIL